MAPVSDIPTRLLESLWTLTFSVMPQATALALFSAQAILLGIRLLWSLDRRTSRPLSQIYEPEVFWGLCWITGIDLALLLHVEPAAVGEVVDEEEEKRLCGVRMQLDYILVMIMRWGVMLALMGCGVGSREMFLLLPFSGLLGGIVTQLWKNRLQPLHKQIFNSLAITTMYTVGGLLHFWIPSVPILLRLWSRTAWAASMQTLLLVATRLFAIQTLTNAHKMNAKAELHLAASKLRRRPTRRTLSSRLTAYRAPTHTIPRRGGVQPTSNCINLPDRIEIEQVSAHAEAVHLSSLNMSSWFFLLSMKEGWLFFVFVPLGVFGEVVVRIGLKWVKKWWRGRQQKKIENLGSAMSLDVVSLSEKLMDRISRRESRKIAYDHLCDFIGTHCTILTTSLFILFFISTSPLTPPSSLTCLPVDRISPTTLAFRTLFSIVAVLSCNIVVVLMVPGTPVFEVSTLARLPVMSYFKTAGLNFGQCGALLAIMQFVEKVRGCEGKS